MNREQADKALASGQMCTADLNGQVFICWIESILQIKGKWAANVRTVRGRKQLAVLELISIAQDGGGA